MKKHYMTTEGYLLGIIKYIAYDFEFLFQKEFFVGKNNTLAKFFNISEKNMTMAKKILEQRNNEKTLHDNWVWKIFSS